LDWSSFQSGLCDCTAVSNIWTVLSILYGLDLTKVISEFKICTLLTTGNQTALNSNPYILYVSKDSFITLESCDAMINLVYLRIIKEWNFIFPVMCHANSNISRFESMHKKYTCFVSLETLEWMNELDWLILPSLKIE
jgi:hypothetical protein